ncbi:hypothetical protein S83_048426 [Arachis hypogaea]
MARVPLCPAFTALPRTGRLSPPSLVPLGYRRLASRRLRYISFFVIDSREANKSGNNWLPLPWAIVALLILGFNEFMTLLRNPLYLILIFIGYLVIKALSHMGAT